MFTLLWNCEYRAIGRDAGACGYAPNILKHMEMIMSKILFVMRGRGTVAILPISVFMW